MIYLEELGLSLKDTMGFYFLAHLIILPKLFLKFSALRKPLTCYFM